MCIKERKEQIYRVLFSSTNVKYPQRAPRRVRSIQIQFYFFSFVFLNILSKSRSISIHICTRLISNHLEAHV
jgi:hypothetical protein